MSQQLRRRDQYEIHTQYEIHALTTYPYSGSYRKLELETNEGLIKKIVLLAKDTAHRDIKKNRRLAMGVRENNGDTFGLGYIFIENSAANLRIYPTVNISLPTRISELRSQILNRGECARFDRLSEQDFYAYTHIATETNGCSKTLQKAPRTSPGEITDEIF
ncbi:hypothetical protein [Bradymonas sediminis]|uniref:hypothetical protein n=1 Tax=Bradymonas sediminis TaxID=1548548 RepID=UPI00106157BC|nr:hypothetical protein [Bradymonas sediminis]